MLGEAAGLWELPRSHRLGYPTSTAASALDRPAAIASLECELLDRHSVSSLAEAQIAVFGFTEGFNDPSRRRSSIGCSSPMAFETAFQTDCAPAGSANPETCP
ncbi:MAG: hypothetical protein AAF322_14855 [Pseudomonadota bacterium]